MTMPYHLNLERKCGIRYSPEGRSSYKRTYL
jgi:hypothetical protein